MTGPCPVSIINLLFTVTNWFILIHFHSIKTINQLLLLLCGEQRYNSIDSLVNAHSKKKRSTFVFPKKGYLYWWTTYVSIIHLLLCYLVIHLTYYYFVMLRKNVMWPSSLLLSCTHSYLWLEGYNSNTLGLLNCTLKSCKFCLSVYR